MIVGEILAINSLVKGSKRLETNEILNKETYLRCLVKNEMISGRNTGFILINTNIKTYKVKLLSLLFTLKV
jgi:hypothetical protein